MRFAHFPELAPLKIQVRYSTTNFPEKSACNKKEASNQEASKASSEQLLNFSNVYVQCRVFNDGVFMSM